MYIAHELLLYYVAAASIEATQRHGAIHRGRVRHHHVVAYVALILRVLRLMRMRCTPRPTRVQVMYLQHVRICPQFFLLSGERWHIFCCLVIATGGVVVPGFFERLGVSQSGMCWPCSP
jgi:accessory gene regulator protein AgrB